jgi:hypothetical protein
LGFSIFACPDADFEKTYGAKNIFKYFFDLIPRFFGEISRFHLTSKGLCFFSEFLSEK